MTQLILLITFFVIFAANGPLFANGMEELFESLERKEITINRDVHTTDGLHYYMNHDTEDLSPELMPIYNQIPLDLGRFPVLVKNLSTKEELLSTRFDESVNGKELVLQIFNLLQVEIAKDPETALFSQSKIQKMVHFALIATTQTFEADVLNLILSNLKENGHFPPGLSVKKNTPEHIQSIRIYVRGPSIIVRKSYILQVLENHDACDVKPRAEIGVSLGEIFVQREITVNLKDENFSPEKITVIYI